MCIPRYLHWHHMFKSVQIMVFFTSHFSDMPRSKNFKKGSFFLLDFFLIFGGNLVGNLKEKLLFFLNFWKPIKRFIFLKGYLSEVFVCCFFFVISPYRITHALWEFFPIRSHKSKPNKISNSFCTWYLKNVKKLLQ